MAAATKLNGVFWSSRADGYSDTLEGAQYLLPHIKTADAPRWLDEETGRLMSAQGEDGFVIGSYLDGNFVRTSLLYAFFRTQGARIVPWRSGLRPGAVLDGGSLFMSLNSDAEWNGHLMFDTLRHKDHVGLAFDYPRLNSWPEWFPVDPKIQYQVVVRGKGEDSVRTVSGSDLIAGLELNLAKEEVRITVKPLSAT